MSDSERYKCPNCDHEQRLDHDGHSGPLCPACRVESMTQMDSVECRECGGDKFEVRQGAAGAPINGAEPTVECVGCGWTARVDGSGVWS